MAMELKKLKLTEIRPYERNARKNEKAAKYIHATQKPIELASIAIRNTTENKNMVLDLFGGSGSTLVACEQLDRTCYMMELDPKYVDVIIDRWEQFTGEKAVLIEEV